MLLQMHYEHMKKMVVVAAFALVAVGVVSL
jgi:hypothetical protein